MADGGHFRDHYELLGAIFANKSMPNKEEAGMIEMSKSDLISILNDANILIAKVEETKEAAKGGK